jgi:hypothetical protein
MVSCTDLRYDSVDDGDTVEYADVEYAINSKRLPTAEPHNGGKSPTSTSLVRDNAPAPFGIFICNSPL